MLFIDMTLSMYAVFTGRSVVSINRLWLLRLFMAFLLKNSSGLLIEYGELFLSVNDTRYRSLV